MRRFIPRLRVAALAVVAVSATLMAQQAAPPAALTPPAATVMDGGTIRGTVKVGQTPLPGVSVTATNTLTGKKYATTTDISGAFAMSIPREGRYVVKAELTAFAPATEEVVLNASGENGGKPEQVIAFAMQLASRAAAQQAAQASGVRRGTQPLNLSGGSLDVSDASMSAGNNTGVEMPSMAGMNSTDSASESVAISGQMGETNGLANFNEDEMRQRIQDAMAQARSQGGAVGDVANAVAGMIGDMMGPGGGMGMGMGGPMMGGRGGGGGRGGRGGFRSFNPTQPHGAIFYQGAFSALNATPFSVAYALGEPSAQPMKPSSMQNRFGVSFTGSPYIPGLTKPSTKQFVFLNVTGVRNMNPMVLQGTVPTLAERGGDFSDLLTSSGGGQLYDPLTGQPFAANNIANRITPQANALLSFYPAPTFPGTRNNYQTVMSMAQNATTAAMRYVRNFGQNSGFGMMRQRQASAPNTLRQSINFNGSYSHNASDISNIFPQMGGSSSTTGYAITAGYTIGYGRINNNASLNWNRSNAQQQNYYTHSGVDPMTGSGITIPKPVIGAAPGIYFGVPSLTLTGYQPLSQTAASERIHQTISFSDRLSYRYGKHNMRFGGDYRRVHADSIVGSGGFGTFTFSGYATADPTADCTSGASNLNCGNSFADMLLGLPQQSAIQAGGFKTYLRANVFDLYGQDDWRARPNLTLNYGLRYEYFSPYVEKFNRLVNLQVNFDPITRKFISADPVEPGDRGIPRSLVDPDRTMLAPRFGFAWRLPKAFKDTVIRGGYGLNFNTGQYASIAQNLSSQPPFAITQTNIVGTGGCTSNNMTLAPNNLGPDNTTKYSAFYCSSATTQNNFGANRNYRLGHVQVWNLDIQHTFPMGIVFNLGYNGSRGGRLDIWRAPNRTITGLLNPDAQAFNYEDSVGESRYNGLAVNVRKRMQKGIALAATYTYGHSIDNASSIGGSAPTPAQNDLDLPAEEGNSSFDVRHKVSGNWVFELPFGPNRALLAKGGFWSKALDGFSVSGNFTFASGTYFTPHFSATSRQVSTGANDSLRPNRVFTEPIAGPRTMQQWFNTAAFDPKEPAEFGSASRGSIEGPGTVSINASLARTVQLGETRSFEARVTANNAFNTVQYAGIDTIRNSPTFGEVNSVGSMRTLTFIARYRF